MGQTTCTIGLDIGTTSVKAIALDEAGTEIAGARQRLQLYAPASGVAEQDAEAVCAALTAVFANCVEQTAANGYRIEAVGFSATKLMERVGLPQELIVSGKLFDTAWVRQLLADVFVLPVLHHGGSDASTVGAIMLAHLALGKPWTGNAAYQTRHRISETKPDAGASADVRRRCALFVDLLGTVSHPRRQG